MAPELVAADRNGERELAVELALTVANDDFAEFDRVTAEALAAIRRALRDGEETDKIGQHQREGRASQDKADIVAGERLDPIGQRVVEPRERDQDADAQHRARGGVADGGHRQKQPRLLGPRG